VPLPDNELRQITVSLLERYPELAGSPGAKVAVAYQGGPGTTTPATVIYYPHYEHRGVKEALQARCRRTLPSTSWTCDEVEIRRYLQLASQDFEVRVLGELSSETAFALIEASRRDLSAGVADGSATPTTAVMVMPHHGAAGEYIVGWGTPDEGIQLAMHARLANGTDPTDPGNWRASIVDPSAP